jgi:hypothetical protein
MLLHHDSGCLSGFQDSKAGGDHDSPMDYDVCDEDENGWMACSNERPAALSRDLPSLQRPAATTKALQKGKHTFTGTMAGTMV